MGRHHRKGWLSWILWACAIFMILTLLLWCGSAIGAKATPRHDAGSYSKSKAKQETERTDPFHDYIINWGFDKPSQACQSIHSSQSHFLLLVSTLDGSLSAIDMRKSGELLWSLKVDERPLLSSSVGSITVTRNGESFQLIPGLNGELYLSDGQSVDKFELTAESLLSSSIRITDNAVFVGGKEIGSYGVDISTGQVVFSCTAAGCRDISEAKSSSGNILVISHVLRTVRAVDIGSGAEKWNFSVGQHDLVYSASSDKDKPAIEQDPTVGEDDVQSPNCTPSDIYDYYLRTQEERIAKQLIRVAMASGSIVGMKADDASEMDWSRQFASPVAKVWFLHQGKVEAVNLFDGRVNPGLSISSESAASHHYMGSNPSLFVGRHKHQMYVLEQTVDINTCKSADMPWIVQHDNNPAPTKHPLIKWKPYKNMVLTPLLQGNRAPQVPLLGQFQDSENSDLNSKDTELAVWTENYPFDDGYYLYPEYNIYEHRVETDILEEESAAEEILIVVASLSVWWKEVLSIGLLMAVCFQMLVVKLSPQAKSNENLTQSTSSSESKDSLASCDSSQQLLDRSSLSLTSEFRSRFADEYECIKCLGKGGYGIVYQTKYKMDEQEYAIKRIAVPNSDSSVRKKILREVRTLAVLDHVGIVRYFHSWMEEPPIGWQEERDKQLLVNGKGSGDWRSPTPTIETSIVDNVPSSLSSHCQSKLAARSLKDGKKSSLLSEIMPCGGLNNNGSGEFSMHSGAEWSGNESGSFSYAGSTGFQGAERDEQSSSSLVLQAGKIESFASPSIVPIRKFTETDKQQSKLWLSESVENSDSVMFAEDSGNAVCGKSFKASNLPRNELSNCSTSIVFEDSRSTKHKPSQGDISDMISANNHSNISDIGEDPCSTHSIHFTLSSHRNSESTNIYGINFQKDCAKNDPIERNMRKDGDDKAEKKINKTPVPKLFLYIQMQLCRLETLKDWLLSHTLDRDSTVCVDIFWQIVNAVDYVHSKGLIHRDLKPSNIFFALDGTVKVGDFGLVTAAENQPDLGQAEDGKGGNSKHTADVGTQLYMSPEQIEKKPYDQKVDIFSLGLILLELLVPFSTGMERILTLQGARKGNFPSEFCRSRSEASDLVRQLLSISPENRPTTQQILQDSFLQTAASPRTYRFRTISSSSSDPFLKQETDE